MPEDIIRRAFVPTPEFFRQQRKLIEKATRKWYIPIDTERKDILSIIRNVARKGENQWDT